MSELILSCYLGMKYKWDPPSEPFVFQRVTQTAELPVTLAYRIEKVTEIYESKYNTVYRASLLNHESGELRNIVLKTDVNARDPRTKIYSLEALRYEKDLARLQGTHIPRCYGLFQGMMYDKLVSVLLLEDCGKSVNFDDDSPDVEKTQIWMLVTELHVRGFAHHDLDGRNILKNEDGEFFLIDLEDSTPHKCEMRLRVFIKDFAPSKEEFGCTELHKVAMRLGFWLPVDLSFYGLQVPVFAYQEGEAQNLVDMVPAYMIPTPDDRQAAFQRAEEMIKAVLLIQAAHAAVPDEKRYVHPSFFPKKSSTSQPQFAVYDAKHNSAVEGGLGDRNAIEAAYSHNDQQLAID